MASRAIKVLAIDDNLDNLVSVKAILKEAFPEAVTLTALSGKNGLEMAAAEDPDVILLDIVMPGMDGYEVCEKLKADKKLSDIPVVFVTALKGDREKRIRALEAGAEAFIAKPIEETELTAQIRAMVKIKTANIKKRDEKERLAALVEEQTRELKKTHATTLNVLADLKKEIEARKKNEEALLESEKLHRSLFENMLNGFAYCQMLFEYGQPRDFIYLAVNNAFESQTGLKNVVGRRVSEVVPGILESNAHLLEIYGRVALTGNPERFEKYIEALQMWFAVSVYSPKKEFFVAVFDVVDDREKTEVERELIVRLMQLINNPTNLHDLIHGVTDLLKGWTGCDAIGIRLRDGEDFPYFETSGFPSSFIKKENFLCAHDLNGQILRDSIGNPMLECMCGNILCGRFDPAKPFFTKYGSFWSNNTSALLASTTESDRRGHTRNRCNSEGYESVAFIPLRASNEFLD